MIILYIPFPRQQAGDLTSLVEQWKCNHLENSKDPIQIIYHQDELDLEPNFDTFEIYICAHGNDSQDLKVGNNSNLQHSLFIDPQTVANRFNEDFSYIFFKIQHIHLYCCGTQYKNQRFAACLQDCLLRPEMCDIIFYSGNLTIVDVNGRQWSYELNRVDPIENVSDKIYKQQVDLESPRKCVKRSSLEYHLREAQVNRRESFFKAVADARKGKMYRIRELFYDDFIQDPANYMRRNQ